MSKILLEAKDFKKKKKESPDTEVDGIRKNFVMESVEEVKIEGTDDRVLRFIISSSSVDRDNDTLDVNGWEISNYMKNPVVLFGHDGRSPPVAKSNTIFFENDLLKSDAQFMPKDMSEFSDMLYKMYLGGYMRATSVGFNPTEYVWSEERDWGIDFKKQELLEYSLVPVPANPDAIMEARKSGIETSPLMSWAEEVLDTKSYKGLLVPKSAIEKLYKDADGKSKVTIWVDNNGVTVEAEDINDNEDKDTDVNIEKKPISYASAHPEGTLKAERDEAWDATGEVAAAEIADLKIMSTWVDPEKENEKDGYVLPHHKTDAGHTLVWKGVASAMETLLGGNGNLEIPDTERKGVYNHLVEHYEDFDEVAPEFKYVEAQILKHSEGLLEFDFGKGQIVAVTKDTGDEIPDNDDKGDSNTEKDFIDDMISALSTDDDEDKTKSDDVTDIFKDVGLSTEDLAEAISTAVKSEVATITGKLD